MGGSVSLTIGTTGHVIRRPVTVAPPVADTNVPSAGSESVMRTSRAAWTDRFRVVSVYTTRSPLPTESAPCLSIWRSGGIPSTVVRCRS